jgi:hypothetical protein
MQSKQRKTMKTNKAELTRMNRIFRIKAILFQVKPKALYPVDPVNTC